MVMKTIYKYIMNSSYGKLGTRDHKLKVWINLKLFQDAA